MARGSLYIWLNRDDETIRSFDSYKPFFECLRRSFLPPPSALAIGNRKPSRISDYDAPSLVKALDKAQDNVTITSADDVLKILLWPLDNRTAISLYLNPATPEQNRELFLQLSEAIRPTYGRCHLYSAMTLLEQEHYKATRTFYTDGLFWLNIFGPEEEQRQGGQALENNPFTQVERLSYGLVLQVCDSPEEASTPEGVQRLVQATNSMPQLPGKTPIVATPGVPGFFDPATATYWITKNIVPAKSLDSQSIQAIRLVLESTNPPVAKVHVLFSMRQAAELNKSKLQDFAESWYVSAETGQPERA